ncbi:MAG: TetR family transcriptional regulator C-terminal domain-containing protein, partial [Bacteroidota bacterium]
TSIDADDNIPILRSEVVEALDYWHQRVVCTLEKGQEKGLIKTDVVSEDFATLYIGMIEGAIMMSRIYRDIRPFNVMSQQLLEKIEQLRA